MEKRIILASQSPRRKELLAGLGLSFVVMVSNVDEDKAIEAYGSMTPVELVKLLSKVKAEAVAKDISDAIVIGADTIVVLADEILGKPKHSDDARSMLKKLSGKTHLVISGITVIDTTINESYTSHVITEVDFKEISEQEIAGYLEKANYLDKAGAYAIQEHAALFVTGIRGCFFNVVGLPLFETCQILKKFDIKIF